MTKPIFILQVTAESLKTKAIAAKSTISEVPNMREISLALASSVTSCSFG